MPSNPDTSEVTLDAVFSALAHSIRRDVLSMIVARNPRKGGEFESDDLVESSGEPERHYLELYHNHLPRLDEAGFIEWNQETDTILKGPNFEGIRPLIELVQDHEDELPEDWP